MTDMLDRSSAMSSPVITLAGPGVFGKVDTMGLAGVASRTAYELRAECSGGHTQ